MLEGEQGLESALYIGDNFEVTPKLSLYAGLRYSFYQYLGAKDVYLYAPGGPREKSTLTDTLHYGNGKTIAHYSGAEPRFSARYASFEFHIDQAELQPYAAVYTDALEHDGHYPHRHLEAERFLSHAPVW